MAKRKQQAEQQKLDDAHVSAARRKNPTGDRAT